MTSLLDIRRLPPHHDWKIMTRRAQSRREEHKEKPRQLRALRASFVSLRVSSLEETEPGAYRHTLGDRVPRARSSMLARYSLLLHCLRLKYRMSNNRISNAQVLSHFKQRHILNVVGMRKHVDGL